MVGLLHVNMDDECMAELEDVNVLHLVFFYVTSVKPQAKKSDLVIELIRTNNWRTAVVSDKRPIQTSKHLPAESDDSVEQQAIREILAGE